MCVPSHGGRKGGFTLKNEKVYKEVNFGAGRAFDAFGRPTSFWSGVVAYRWDAAKQAFLVDTVQVLGTGTVTNSRSYKQEVTACEEVNDFLGYYRELQAHYKGVYE